MKDNSTGIEKMKSSEFDKYALKELGRHFKSKNGDVPDEDKGFKYVSGHLKYLNNLRSKDENKRNQAYDELAKCFENVAKIAERIVSKL